MLGDLLERVYFVATKDNGFVFKVGESSVIALNENITSCSFVSWITGRSAGPWLYFLIVKGAENSILLIQVNFFFRSLHSPELVGEVYFDKTTQLCLSIFLYFTIFCRIGQVF